MEKRLPNKKPIISFLFGEKDVLTKNPYTIIVEFTPKIKYKVRKMATPLRGGSFFIEGKSYLKTIQI